MSGTDERSQINICFSLVEPGNMALKTFRLYLLCGPILIDFRKRPNHYPGMNHSSKFPPTQIIGHCEIHLARTIHVRQAHGGIDPSQRVRVFEAVLVRGFLIQFDERVDVPRLSSVQRHEVVSAVGIDTTVLLARQRAP